MIINIFYNYITEELIQLLNDWYKLKNNKYASLLDLLIGYIKKEKNKEIKLINLFLENNQNRKEKLNFEKEIDTNIKIIKNNNYIKLYNNDKELLKEYNLEIFNKIEEI